MRLQLNSEDDILDVISDSAVLGKSTGKDERDSKATFVTLLGLEGAESRLSEEINCAKSILSNFKDKGYNTGDYETLIDYLENRNK